MKKWLASTVAVAMLLGGIVLGGCGPKAAPQTGEGTGGQATGALTVAGSDTMVNIAQAWAAAFMAANPGVQIAVKGGGSGTGIAALINGTVDFANASRDIKDEEVTQAKAKGIDPVQTEVARDGIAVIANPANKVEGLTIDQLGKIYRGEITNWKQVGGADAPIGILSRDPSSGTYEYFKDAVVGKEKNYAKTAKLLPTSQSIVEEVKADPNGIGYVGVGYENAGIKVLAIEGAKASVATVLDGTYKLSRGLFMYGNGAPKGLGKVYTDWILSAAGQKIVKDQGFVPVK